MADVQPTAAEIGAKGGKARAESLTAEERSEQARHAVEARWNQATPKATHAGELKIGDAVIPCAVLDDETRVLTQRGFSVALGRNKNPNKKGSIVELPVFLSATNLKPFIDDELIRSATQVRFRMAEGSGGFAGNVALGYRADLLPRVCNVYLRAKQEGKLLKSQEHIAEKCLILLNGLATVGIIALVDEATGFQDERARGALAKILERFIAKELQPYLPTFPLDFFKELCRLKGVTFPKNMRLPPYFGKLVNHLVYRRLAPGVLAELRRVNPVIENGRRKNKNYKWLTPTVGHPKLLQLLGSEVTLMKMSETYADVEKLVDRFHEVHHDYPLLDWAKNMDQADL
ncbi:MAG TPA: P63C domain-containing protein [Gemmataceae bacterium]|jgi:hypothetical protein|nr:P63C domain-containing protein [Gemmataceae bacterium]